MHGGVLHHLGERIVRREAGHQRDVHAEAGEVGELEVEEAQALPVEHRRERLDPGTEAGGHAAGEHDGSDLAALDRGAARGRQLVVLPRSGGRQRLHDVGRGNLDRLADAVHRLGIGRGCDEALAQLLEGDMIEAEAPEQRLELGRDLAAAHVHHGPL